MSFASCQEFKLDELLPTDSYLARWFQDHRKHFPDSGFPGEIYVGEVDYSMQQLQKLDFIVSGMERFADDGEFVVEADFWWSKLRHFLQGGDARPCHAGFLNRRLRQQDKKCCKFYKLEGNLPHLKQIVTELDGLLFSFNFATVF